MVHLCVLFTSPGGSHGPHLFLLPNKTRIYIHSASKLVHKTWWLAAFLKLGVKFWLPKPCFSLRNLHFRSTILQNSTYLGIVTPPNHQFAVRSTTNLQIYNPDCCEQSNPFTIVTLSPTKRKTSKNLGVKING